MAYRFASDERRVLPGAPFTPRHTGSCLGVAADHAAVSLQEAHLLSEQKRIAEELDRKVAQRTRELHATSIELERALRQIDDLKAKLQLQNTTLREEVSI